MPDTTSAGVLSLTFPALPMTLPSASADDPAELSSFRSSPGDANAFEALRKKFGEQESWRALFKLICSHSQAFADDGDRVHDLLVEAAEIARDRLGDKIAAAHCLARALDARPTQSATATLLLAAYRDLGWSRERLLALEFLTKQTASYGFSERSAWHAEAAKLLWDQFSQLPPALAHLRSAADIDSKNREATRQQIRIFLIAGAWEQAARELRGELEFATQADDAEAIATTLAMTAFVEKESKNDIAGAAKHLQLALEKAPGHLMALQQLAAIYTEARVPGDKAASLFVKTARAAQRAGDENQCIALCHRALEIDPSQQHAFELLSEYFRKHELWHELDVVLEQRIASLTGKQPVGELALERAQLLEEQLQSNYLASTCYLLALEEDASREAAVTALARLYRESHDTFALVSLYESEIDRHGDSAPIELLIETAKLYRDVLDDPARAAIYDFKVLERDPFHELAGASYKEHFRRRHSWTQLRDLLAFRIEQAEAGEQTSAGRKSTSLIEEYAELADLCERRLGDMDGALDAWRRLANSHPEDSRPQEHIARIEKRVSMWDTTLETLEDSLESATDDSARVEILRRITLIYRDRFADPTRTIELYRELLGLTPDDPQARRAILGLYERAEDHRQVVETLQEQCKRAQTPAEHATYLRRIADLCQHQLDDKEGAIAANEELLSVAPRSLDALRRIQQIELQRGNLAAFRAACLRECEMLPKPEAKAPHLRRLARILAQEARTDEATAVLEQLHQLFPNKHEPADRLFASYTQSGKFSQALELLERLNQQHSVSQPRKLALLRQAASLASDGDDIAQQLGALERYVQSDSHAQWAWRQLVQLYRTTNDIAREATALERLAELCAIETERDEALRRRAQLVSEHLGQHAEAARTLLSIQRPLCPNPRALLTEILAELRQTDDNRRRTGQLELLLLGESDYACRLAGYHELVETWRAIGDLEAALAVQTRLVKERPQDLDLLRELAEIQIASNRLDEAYTTLEHRVEELNETPARRTALNELSDLAIDHKDIDRALGYQRRALLEDIHDDEQWIRLEDFCSNHGHWSVALDLMTERVKQLENQNDIASARVLCIAAAELTLGKLSNSRDAAAWLKRGYLIDLVDAPERTETRDRLIELTRSHGLDRDFFEIQVEEINMRLAGDRSQLPPAEDPIYNNYLFAAETLTERLDAPKEALTFLLIGWRKLEAPSSLAARISELAQQCEDWDALIELQEMQLTRTNDAPGRCECHQEIASLLLERKHLPMEAFCRLRTAWDELLGIDPAVAEGLHASIVELGRRHGLWEPLASYLARKASLELLEQLAVRSIEHVCEAALIYWRELNRPTEALRVLVGYIQHDPSRQIVLELVREISREQLGSNTATTRHFAALTLLEAQQRQLAMTSDTDAQFDLLVERAELREQELANPLGALCEWLRILQVDREHETALANIRRICSAKDMASWSLFLPAWLIQSATDDKSRLECLREIAEIYEQRLGRPEYAMRANLALWKLPGQLVGQLQDAAAHRQRWALAQRVGSYRGPALPEEALLQPRLPVPERDDAKLWRTINLDPVSYFVDPVDQANLPAQQANASKAGDNESTEDIEELDVELFDEDFEITDDDGTEAPTSGESTSSASISSGVELTKVVHDGQELTLALTPVRSSGVKPPPVVGQLIAGYPPVPYLAGPILPSRPKLPSAWHELAAVYDSFQPEHADDRIANDRLLAQMWETSAQQPEDAFRVLESLAIRVANRVELLDDVASLAERNDNRVRLRQAYSTILEGARERDVVVELCRRLARMSMDDGDSAGTEAYYRHALTVDPQNVSCLRALCDLYQQLDRQEDYADTYAALLDVQKFSLPNDVRIERTMRLIELQLSDLTQRSEAVATLRFLLDDFPDHLPAHHKLIELLESSEQWAQTIEALRNALEHTHDAAERVVLLRKVASIYSDHLGLPDRAIDSWQQIREVAPEDETAAQHLRVLLAATQRHEQLIALLDELLAHAPAGDTIYQQRILLDKAHAIYQRSTEDYSAAMDCVEAATKIGELTVTDRLRVVDLALEAEDQALAQAQIDTALDQAENMSPAELTRVLRAAIELSDVRGESKQAQLAWLQKLASRLHDAPPVVSILADFARTHSDARGLYDVLIRSTAPRDWVEAGLLASDHLQDIPGATKQFERVLASNLDDALAVRESALLSLVRMRLAAGEPEKAIALIQDGLDNIADTSTKSRLFSDVALSAQRNGLDHESLLPLFEQARALNPEDIGTKIGLAQIETEKGHLEQAQTMLEDALHELELAPNADLVAAGNLAIAQVFERQGQVQEAYRRQAIAQRIAPESLAVRVAIARNRVTAGRWRDVLSAADTTFSKQSFASLSKREKEDALELIQLGARADAQTRRYEQAIDRLQAACALSPTHESTRAYLVELLREAGRHSDAACALRLLANMRGDKGQAGHELVEAGNLGLLAIQTAAEQAVDSAPTMSQTDAFALVESGAAYLAELDVNANVQAHSGSDAKTWDTSKMLLQSFAFARVGHPTLACKLALLLAADSSAGRNQRTDLLLQAIDAVSHAPSYVRDSQEAKTEALACATLAEELRPDSLEIRWALLEQMRGIETQQANWRERLFGGADEARQRIRSLAGEERQAGLRMIREAARSDHPQADAFYLLLAVVAPSLLTAADRLSWHQLAPEAPVDERSRVAWNENLRTLVEIRPFDVAPMDTYCEQLKLRHDDDTHACVLAVKELLSTNGDDAGEAHVPRVVSGDTIDVDALVGPAPASGGVATAMALMWEGAAEPIIEHFGKRPELSAKESMGKTPVQPDLVELVASIQRTLGGQPIELAQSEGLTSPAILQLGTPVVLGIAPGLAHGSISSTTVFHIARALAAREPACLLTAALSSLELTELLSATLIAFHPRHQRRRTASREDSDGANRLALELARKTPLRVARQLERAFRAHESESFDSRQWRKWVERSGDRVGLAICGNLRAAVEALCTPHELDNIAATVENHERIRDLVGFAMSENYVRARRQLGWHAPRD